jgi:acetoin utilization protein AcuB
MLIGERMTHPVTTLPHDMPIVDALDLLKREHIRRAPVVKGGRMVGIISDYDLLNASPSQATSLSVWEMNYLLSKIKVKDVMTKDVITVDVNCTIEEAARIMADNQIGGLPVLREGNLAGIITETDIFKLFLELLGARDPGVRVTALVPEKQGELARLSRAISEAGGNFVSLGVFAGDDITNRELTFKVSGLDEDAVRSAIEPHVVKIKDIRNQNC